MGIRQVARRFRERLVLGPVRADLEPDERILAWEHVQSADHDQHGILVLTDRRGVVSWAARNQQDSTVSWDALTAWDIVDLDHGGPLLTLEAAEAAAAVRLPVSSAARVRRAEQLVDLVDQLAPASARRSRGDTRLALQVQRRGLRGHTRRVAVTIAGGLLILLGGLFASPFLPGPGALTVLAALALLASEYDWARDLYHWFRKRVERFWEQQRAWRARRRLLRRPQTQDA